MEKKSDMTGSKIKSWASFSIRNYNRNEADVISSRVFIALASGSRAQSYSGNWNCGSKWLCLPIIYNQLENPSFHMFYITHPYYVRARGKTQAKENTFLLSVKGKNERLFYFV